MELCARMLLMNAMRYNPKLSFVSQTAILSHFKLYSCPVMFYSGGLSSHLYFFSVSTFALLVRFCHVLFCSIAIFSLLVCVVYSSVTFPVTTSRKMVDTPFSQNWNVWRKYRNIHNIENLGALLQTTVAFFCQNFTDFQIFLLPNSQVVCH